MIDNIIDGTDDYPETKNCDMWIIFAFLHCLSLIIQLIRIENIKKNR